MQQLRSFLAALEQLRRRSMRAGCVPSALGVAVLLMLFSLGFYTALAYYERRYADPVVMERDGYSVAVAYPRELQLTDAQTRGALITVRLQTTPTLAPTAVVTATTPPAVGGAAPASAPTPPATATPAPSAQLVLSFPESEQLVYTDAQGQPVQAAIALTTTLGSNAVGSIYVRPANLAVAAGTPLPLSIQLTAPGGAALVLTPLSGEQPAIRIESSEQFLLRTFFGRLFGDQAVLFGLSLAVIGWAIDAFNRSRERRETQILALRSRVETLMATIEQDLAAGVSDYLELRAAWPSKLKNMEHELQHIARMLEYKKKPEIGGRLLREAGDSLAQVNPDLSRCESLLRAYKHLFEQPELPLYSDNETMYSILMSVLEDAKKIVADKNRLRITIQRLFDLIDKHNEEVLELCAYVLQRLLRAVENRSDSQHAITVLEDTVRSVLFSNDALTATHWQKSRLLLRHELVRNHPIIVRIDAPHRDPGLRRPPWPRAEAATVLKWEVLLHNKRRIAFTLSLPELQPVQAASLLYTGRKHQILAEARPLMVCEPEGLQQAVVEQIINQAHEKPFAAFIELADPALPAQDSAPYFDLVVQAVCEAWWQLLWTLPDTLLDLPPAQQRLIAGLLVAQTGSVDAFAARLSLGLSGKVADESAIFEQLIVRRASETLAGRRGTRLAHGERLTALSIRPKQYAASTLLFVRITAEPGLQPQGEQLVRLAPWLAREQVYLRFFLGPDPPVYLERAGVVRLRWPDEDLEKLIELLMQGAANDADLKYAQLKAWNPTLPALDELVAGAGGSPTRLVELLHAGLRKAALPGPAPRP